MRMDGTRAPAASARDAIRSRTIRMTCSTRVSAPSAVCRVSSICPPLSTRRPPTVANCTDPYSVQFIKIVLMLSLPVRGRARMIGQMA
ncbi:hypothetical protein PSP6_590009 [Paraburkholderia tropica]|nr:hypothetical protein PSP6_590009 [Paraburkholderia tropica]